MITHRLFHIAQMSGSTKYIMIMILINILQTHTKYVEFIIIIAIKNTLNFLFGIQFYDTIENLIFLYVHSDTPWTDK